MTRLDPYKCAPLEWNDENEEVKSEVLVMILTIPENLDKTKVKKYLENLCKTEIEKLKQ